MLEAGCGLRFPAKTFREQWIAQQLRVQHLDGDEIADVHARRAIDDCHAARADLGIDPVLSVDDAPQQRVVSHASSLRHGAWEARQLSDREIPLETGWTNL